VTAPTSGQIRIRGRIASLLEVGTGFHPELTGRENIFLNGAILGMTKVEIRKKFDEIVAFSECEEFIDTPVKRYSSGMYVRLAFAVAAHLEPEILIIDEVLAVGDAKFQKKCLGKMGEASRGGRTVLFVSHNMGAIARLCGRSVLLKAGQVSFVGDSALAIEEYLGGKEASQGAWVRTPGTTTSSGICLQEVGVTNAAGKVTGDLASTESVDIVIVVHSPHETQPLQVAFSLTNHEGVVVFSSASTDLRGELRPLTAGYHQYAVRIPANFLSPGSYSLTVVAHIPRVILFDLVEAIAFNVAHTATGIPDDRSGVVRPLLEWRHSAVTEATDKLSAIP
jgi:lipopolysaccharide transport system ATP-binding protein